MFVTRNKFPHVKAARNTEKVGQAWSWNTMDKSISNGNVRRQALAKWHLHKQTISLSCFPLGPNLDFWSDGWNVENGVALHCR